MRRTGDAWNTPEARAPADTGPRAVTPEQERFAEVLAVERRYGARAPQFVATRVGALAIAGDMPGVARWQAIAAKLELLSTSGHRPE